MAWQGEKGKFARSFLDNPEYKKLGTKNPDVRIGPKGEIVLQHPTDATKIFDTGLNLSQFP